jgi:hypothetical protein
VKAQEYMNDIGDLGLLAISLPLDSINDKYLIK